ncbi:LL-diaminopimelate aminotransferase chloroplastic [Zea mays]|uniref:LL-diaminopimelate aminotransferase chloroplastic n=1 Tax=Zea mays TaxID=4577 RepID=A0A1D6P8F9_MAIZE|nr:LL-diaminopimelate aminotransferase chloroplastic [Zea mays]
MPHTQTETTMEGLGSMAGYGSAKTRCWEERRRRAAGPRRGRLAPRYPTPWSTPMTPRTLISYSDEFSMPTSRVMFKEVDAPSPSPALWNGPQEAGKKVEEEFSTYPLSVLMMSVKNNTKSSGHSIVRCLCMLTQRRSMGPSESQLTVVYLKEKLAS